MVDVGAITSAASDLTSTGLNLIFSQQQNQEARAWEEEQSREAWNRDFYMWQQQNEYNSPVAQMERLKEAGLNPHLMYGVGNVGNATNAPSYQKAKGTFGLPPIQLPDIANIMLDMQTKRVNLDKVREQIEILQEQKDMVRIQNLANVFQLMYENGVSNYDDLPDRFKDNVEQFKSEHNYEEHQGKGLHDYQMDMQKNSVNLVKQRLSTESEQTRLKQKLADWAEIKIDSFEEQGYDATKDTYMDNSMKQLFSEGGAASAKFLLPVLIKMLGIK